MSPQDARFDWVKERAKCSLGTTFDTLATAVEQDVQSVKDLQRAIQDSKTFFEFKRDRNVFTVTRQRTQLAEKLSTVKFRLSISEIAIESDDATFNATPALNQDGKCMLTVNGKELEIWQVCQMALGALFFGVPEIAHNRIEIW
jgi:hypothetical protein